MVVMNSIGSQITEFQSKINNLSIVGSSCTKMQEKSKKSDMVHLQCLSRVEKVCLCMCMSDLTLIC